MEENKRTEIALWRMGVLGPLISARLEHGDRGQFIKEAAQRTYQDHAGRAVELSESTVESWYYQWREGGFDALKPNGRRDAGRSRSISPEVVEQIIVAKQDNPRRSIRRLIRMLEREGAVTKGQLSKSSVHRLLKAYDLSGRPAPEATIERRTFIHPHVGDLWMGDVMHGPKALDTENRVRKVYLHIFLDSASRFVPTCAFRFAETACDHEVVPKEGFLKHGLPRILYEDNGAAQTSESLKIICAELGIRLVHARPYDPQAKGGVERLIRTIREEVQEELPKEPLPITELNSILWAWVSSEYHRRKHSTTGKAPIDHWLEQAEHVRPAPKASELDRIFLHREQRKVRSDSTVRFDGKLLEVRSELCGLNVELRYDPGKSALPMVFVDGQFYCDTNEVDRIKNSQRRRHRPMPHPKETPQIGMDPLRQIQRQYYRQQPHTKPHTKEQ